MQSLWIHELSWIKSLSSTAPFNYSHHRTPQWLLCIHFAWTLVLASLLFPVWCKKILFLLSSRRTITSPAGSLKGAWWSLRIILSWWEGTVHIDRQTDRQLERVCECVCQFNYSVQDNHLAGFRSSFKNTIGTGQGDSEEIRTIRFISSNSNILGWFLQSVDITAANIEHTGFLISRHLLF